MRFVRSLLLGLILITAVSGALFFHYANAPLQIERLPTEFDIRSGSSLRAVARQLSASGIVPDPWRFEALGRMLRVAPNIKAGNYEIDRDLSPLELLETITRGESAELAVTLVEGWNLRQVRAALDANPKLRHDTTVLSDSEIARRLALPHVSPEGWLFPDTYHFTPGSSDWSVIERAHRLMSLRLHDEWEKRAPDVPYASPYEALIMASIVEKETGRASDRPLVASVFVNRLRTGMRLQTDPTVIYGLGESFDGNLRKKDLVSDTPYNTYLRTGLPPTPIAMPGLAALQAALNPAKSAALYFVARGDGSSQFSRTLEEHERAVTKYQRNRKP